MKYKLFISASSNINSITHPYSVSMIPEVVTFNKYESYVYDTELTNVSLLNRIKYTNNEFELSYDYSLIDSMIEDYLKSYDMVIMILIYICLILFLVVIILNTYIKTGKELSDIEEKYKDKLFVITTNSQGYILSNSSLELDKNLKSDMDFKEAINIFNKDDNDILYLYSPQNDILKSDYRYTLENELIDTFEKTEIFRIDNLGMTVEKVNKISPVVYLIKKYLKESNDEVVTPFLMYSNENSYYKDILEKKLLKIYPKLKKLICIPFSPIFIKKYGKFPVAIGYTKK